MLPEDEGHVAREDVSKDSAADTRDNSDKQQQGKARIARIELNESDSVNREGAESYGIGDI